MSEAYYFVGGGIHPFLGVLRLQEVKSENLRRALRCHAVRFADVRPGTVK